MHNRYTQQIEDIKSENSSLHGTIEDLRNDIIDKNAQISELNGSIEQYKDSLRGMMDLEDKVAVFKEQVTGLSSEKKRLLSHHAQEITKFEVKVEGLRADLKRSEGMVKELNEDVAQLSDSNNKNKLEKHEMKKSYDDQQEAIRNIQMKLLNATKSKGKRSRRMSMASLDLQWPAVERAVDDFVNERKRLDKDIKRNESMKKEVDATKARNRKWEREIDEKNEKAQHQLDAMRHQQRELRNIQNEITGRETSLKQKEATFMEKEILLANREQDVEKTEAHLHSLEVSLQEQSDVLEDKEGKLRSDFQALWEKEHSLKIQSLKVDAATAIQRVIRQALLRKASKNSKKLLTQLEDVEARSKLLESQVAGQREVAEKNHSREINLNFWKKT